MDRQRQMVREAHEGVLVSIAEAPLLRALRVEDPDQVASMDQGDGELAVGLRQTGQGDLQLQVPGGATGDELLA